MTVILILFTTSAVAFLLYWLILYSVNHGIPAAHAAMHPSIDLVERRALALLRQRYPESKIIQSTPDSILYSAVERAMAQSGGVTAQWMDCLAESLQELSTS